MSIENNVKTIINPRHVLKAAEIIFFYILTSLNHNINSVCSTQKNSVI